MLTALRRAAAPAVVLIALAIASTASAAPTFTVTTTADSLGTTACTVSACSLRSAVAAADQPANTGATIVLPASSVPYTLTTGDGGELQVTEPVTIQGAGLQSSVIHGDGSHRVLSLDLSSAGTVALSDLEITAGIDRGGEGGGIDSTTAVPGVQVQLSNVDVQNNGADAPAATAGSGDDGSNADGGGIAFSGSASLTITDSTIDGNSTLGGAGGTSTTANAGGGGFSFAAGIYFGSSGTLMISGSTISNNEALGGPGANSSTHTAGEGGEADAGGLEGGSTSDATIVDSTISDNHVVGAAAGSSTSGPGGRGGAAFGGGLLAEGNSLTMRDDAVTGNTAVASQGGSGSSTASGGDARGAGAYVSSAATITGSTFSANNTVSGGTNSDGSGGGLAINGGLSVPVTIANSTITANTADGPSGSGFHGYGGGLATASPIALASDTIDANKAPQGLGGNIGATATVHAEDTIVAAGVAAAGSQNCDGTLTDLSPGHNLEDSGSASQCGLSAASHDILTAPATAGVATALGANGGPTQTLALDATSPARGAGAACVDPTKSGDPALVVDQRGDLRGATCDIGAFQIESPVNTGPPTITGAGTTGSSITCGDGTWTGDGSLSYAVQWSRDGAPISGATAASYTVAGVDAGHGLTCMVTASSAYGSASATSATVSVPVPPLVKVTPPVPLAPPVTPKISKLKQSFTRWREAKRTATVTRRRTPKVVVGTTFTFSLSEASKVTLPFDQLLPGRKVAKACLPQTKRNRRDRKCTRGVDRGTITINGHPGVNHVRFYGRLSNRHLLRLGHYQLQIAATASGRTSVSGKLHFTIVS